jgi:arylsulfatase
MKIRICLTVLSVWFLSGGCTNNKGEDPLKPNIIIIFADDLGYGDLGCFGNPTIRTPNLDRMAHEGMKFTQFYTGASVCTPSRAALLTGRLPIRFGMASNRFRVLFPFSLSGIPQSEITLAEALKEKGYSTAAFGKWHLGHFEEFLPLQHGFDEYFGIPYSNDMSPVTNPWGRAQYFPELPLIEDNTVIANEPDQRVLTRSYTEKALDFINRNQDEPFFLYMPHTFPHIPLFANPDFEGTSNRGLYGDVVEEIDWSVGKILDKLIELNLDDNTFVFFTSDNGPWLTEKENGGIAGLLRQGKGSTWEGGMRVPGIAWWPGKVPAGITTQALATTMDLYATSLDLAGVGFPDDRELDGESLSSVIFENTDSNRKEVFYYLGSELFAYRNGAWKIHFKTYSPYIGETPETHDPPLLYNIEVDPSERWNKSEVHPEMVKEQIAKAIAHKESVKPVQDRMIEVDSVMLGLK